VILKKDIDIMSKNDNLAKIIKEEVTVKKILMEKISALKSYNESDVEILAYRLAEIMISAKNLYTENFKELIEVDSSREDGVWEVIMAMRMNLLHLRDCIEDFDIMMLDLMSNEDELSDEEI